MTGAIKLQTAQVSLAEAVAPDAVSGATASTDGAAETLTDKTRKREAEPNSASGSHTPADRRTR